MEKTFSVSVRLRRVITESAHFSVTITPDLMRSDPNTPRYGSRDGEKFSKRPLNKAANRRQSGCPTQPLL